MEWEKFNALLLNWVRGKEAQCCEVWEALIAECRKRFVVPEVVAEEGFQKFQADNKDVWVKVEEVEKVKVLRAKDHPQFSVYIVKCLHSPPAYLLASTIVRAVYRNVPIATPALLVLFKTDLKREVEMSYFLLHHQNHRNSLPKR